MTDQKTLGEPNDGTTPEDVATLYSWANLHGAKYRDFSSSRAQAREEARLRVEAAQEAERLRLAEEAERKAQEEAQIAARLAAEAAEAARQAEAERLAEIARQAEAERQAVLAAQEAQRQAVQQRTWQPPQETFGGDYAASFGSPDSEQSHTDAFLEEPTSYPHLDLPDFGVPTYPSNLRPAQPAQSSPTQQPDSQQADRSAGTEHRLEGTAAEQPYRGQPYSSQPPSSPLQHQREMYVPQTPMYQPPPTPSFQNPAYAPNRPGPSLAQDRQPAQQPVQTERPVPMYQSPAYPPHQPANQQPAPPQSPAQSPSSHFQPASYSPSNPSLNPSATSGASSYASAAPDPYAQPWQLPDAREQRDTRDLLTRPAWLAPEMPPPAPLQQPNAQPLQAQYSAGSLPSQSTPSPSPQHPQRPAAERQPMYLHGQTSPASQTPLPGYSSTQASGSGQGAVEDTLVGSRDRIANRWYALKSVFDPNAAPVEQQQQQAPVRVPVLAVFSLAGGVGKTSIVAALGRALSARGERILLVDTATYGLLPFFFGARDQRPGTLRTFNPPGISAEAPIQLVTLDPEGQAPDIHGAEQHPHQEPNQQQHQDWLPQEVTRLSRGASRILIDLPTASGSTTRRLLRMAPVVLVPVVPDMNSVVSVGAIESFFRNSPAAGGKQILPHYVLNQFDYSLPLHLDVREILREQIGDRLLPFALRRSSAISEALAEGMTVIDYAPTATVAEDYASLAGWVRSLSAPAAVVQRGVRWSER